VIAESIFKVLTHVISAWVAEFAVQQTAPISGATQRSGIDHHRSRAGNGEAYEDEFYETRSFA
jgi:hypothetical protein